MDRKYNNESLLEKIARNSYKYNVGPVKIESPIRLKPPIKRKDTRAFIAATAAGSVASRYNRAKINNGQEVGGFGRFMAENPGTTMIGANVVAGLGSGGKNAIKNKLDQRKTNNANEDIKVANDNQRSEFEKYASHGFLTSTETERRFLENHKSSDLALVKLAFALEASGELHRIDQLIEGGGDKVLDDYMKVAYDVCSEGIEKEAGAVRRALVNGAAGFLSGGATNLMGSIPNTVASSALSKVYDTAGNKASAIANKGIDTGIDKVIDFEMKMKKNKADRLGMQKAASYQGVDPQAELDKLDQAFSDRDLKKKASAEATKFEKIAAQEAALGSLLGGRVKRYEEEEGAIQAFDAFIADGDDSDIGLEDEIKLANADEHEEDSLKSAVNNMEIDEPLDSEMTSAQDEDSIWDEDPSDLIE